MYYFSRPKSLNNISAQEETLITLNHSKDNVSC
jgi:hypothetical protein